MPFAIPSFLANAVDKFSGLDKLQAVIALAIDVAMADGTYDQSEDRQIRTSIKASPVLRNFPPSQVEKLIAEFADQALSSPYSAQLRVNKELKDIENDQETGKLAFAIACEVAFRSGGIGDAELAKLHQRAQQIHVDPGEFGLPPQR